MDHLFVVLIIHLESRICVLHPRSFTLHLVLVIVLVMLVTLSLLLYEGLSDSGYSPGLVARGFFPCFFGGVKNLVFCVIVCYLLQTVLIFPLAHYNSIAT
jgi:membrane-anchored glycerophosphoryl diester phosphodiesterase (GDPDase)